MRAMFDRVFRRLRVGNSLAERLRFSFMVVLCLMLIPALVSIWTMRTYADSYHQDDAEDREGHLHRLSAAYRFAQHGME